MTKHTTFVLAVALTLGLVAGPNVLAWTPAPVEPAATPQGADFAQHQNNLKQLGVAFHNYHDNHKHFPTHAIYGKDGTPLLSWRVTILPYIEEDALYKQFKLDEPWDSPNNRPLIAKMPKLYEPLGQGKPGEGKTHYQVFTGPGTAFDGPQKTRLVDITDGTSNTILVVEAGNPVTWTKPDDLTLPQDKDRLPALGGLFKQGFAVLFCDGAVRTFAFGPNPGILRALISPRGGEVVDADKLEAK